MSGMRPFFITGANAKIKINGKTIAFCTDLNYTVEVLHQTPKVLGMYEGTSVEPLGYTVSGSFTIIRYAKTARAAVGGTISPHGVAVNDAGNGVGNWGAAWDGKTASLKSIVGLGNANDARANESLNPSKLSHAAGFDIVIYQKAASGPPAPPKPTGLAGAFAKVGGFLSNPVGALKKSKPKGQGDGSLGNYIGVAKIRNCRITRADFKISKKNVAMQTFNFVALYADEDAFAADSSGDGQQFSS